MKAEWRTDIPEDNRRVLVVKELKSGKHELAFGYYNDDFVSYDGQIRGTWVSTGYQRIVCWTDLPEVP